MAVIPPALKYAPLATKLPFCTLNPYAVRLPPATILPLLTVNPTLVILPTATSPAVRSRTEADPYATRVVPKIVPLDTRVCAVIVF